MVSIGVLAFILLTTCSCCFGVLPSDEVSLLLKLKTALQKSSTTVFESWREGGIGNACNFTGISCDSEMLVSGISLPGEQLIGTVPFDSICRLSHLQRIDLGSNRLSGTLDLTNCTGLIHVDLSQNFISGNVPDLSSLYRLNYFNINGSFFSGYFPWKSLENATGLGFLSIGDNPFRRSPFPKEITALRNLYWLYLSNCSLEGEIPNGIGNLTNLTNLELSDNFLSGEIPPGITRLVNLRQLELYNNHLRGNIPAGFGNLKNLVNFDASQNRLHGSLYEIRSLTSLVSLQLFENQFAGEIPPEIGDFRYLTELSLYTNRLSGTLPAKLGSWSRFIYVDVSENLFTGVIPSEMCRHGKMTDLLLLQNRFTGGIPETYSGCLSLERLRVSNNSLSGEVPPGIFGLPELRIIDLAYNNFRGSLPSDVGKSKSLAQVFLSNNVFSGDIPAVISGAESLVSIDLSYNRFTGGIPASIRLLGNLDSLRLQSNALTGTIPETIGSCSSLTYLNLANNYFSGSIPKALSFLPSLNSLNLSSNKLSGEIPSTLSLLRLSLLDLTNNELTGSIPASLSIEAYTASFDRNPNLCSSHVTTTATGLKPCPPGKVKASIRKYSVIGVILACFISALIVVFLSIACIVLSRPLNQNRKIVWEMKRFRKTVTFTEQEIVASITPEKMIGKGGSGYVYRVDLRNGGIVAVKHIIMTATKNQDREYDAEASTLSSVCHVNVVKLYCSISSDAARLLVYEYLPNGSLWDRLHMKTDEKEELSWKSRMRIAIGAARGLEYLHHGCDRPIIHRDVKSSNILLDESLNARIADFGLAKTMNESTAMTTHAVAGTLGYLPPEYAYTYKINEKCDIYSFGVVLMELVTGKGPVEPEFGEGRGIVGWVCDRIETEGGWRGLVDSRVGDDECCVVGGDVIRLLKIAVMCTSRLPALRPSMRVVVQMLEQRWMTMEGKAG